MIQYEYINFEGVDYMSNEIDARLERVRKIDEKFKELERKAKSGGVVDMLNLAEELYNVQLHGRAEEWYEKAAATGDPDAICELGGFYLRRSHFVENTKDTKDRGIKLIEKAAHLGSSEALLYLATSLIERGGKQGEQEAFELWRTAANLGNAKAMLYLGDFYRGFSVLSFYKEPLNYQVALEWYERSAKLGNKRAIECVDFMKNKIKECKEKLEEFKELTEKARSGDASAMYAISKYYENGIGDALMRDYKQCIVWHKKAAELGDVDAMYYLGIRYFNGNIVEKNLDEAMNWFLKVAMKEYEARGILAAHNEDAFSYLGLIYVMRQRAFQEKLKNEKSIDELFAPLYSSYGVENNKKSGRK